MKSLFEYISWIFFGRVVKQKLRSSALHSLRLYVRVVGGARKAAMFAVLGIFALASIVVGFFMLIGGLLWLANLNPDAYPWILVGVGAVFTLAGLIGFIFAFREKFWLDLSRADELLQATLEKFPANERPTNPAVSGMWTMAAEARITEHSRIEEEQLVSKPSMQPAT